ncbi:MAG: hypothetical protein ACLUG9_16995 [Paraclostridium sordellii]|uniref:hypothetical protein n=1 Tax=Paraclostridium sordellii TaxID=1505 RepID=UPI0005E4F2EB|nr:hypothetical protein [Paeniclostridium sordellii]MVO75958.1 hypothetical protein [Paeniclostridium sordellii]CEN29936.1 Uncharacterised protein [[Clostridium] sordellii] [Paeniclostridium sordellii]CEN30448.1 Uncharacterised protein [[Clostridium] sordellii] [Paeniclostridium sordellii]
MNKLKKNLLKLYIGYLEERDEYQQCVIYKTLAITNIYSFYLLSVCMMVSLIFDSINHTLTFGTIALVFIQQFNTYYIFNKLRKNGIDKTEFYDDITYSRQIKKLRKQAIITGIQWGFYMLLMMEYIFPTLLGERISIDLFEVLLWLFGGVLFGGSMYILGKLKLIKVDSK